ncbi:hypothetical protein GCM10010269_24370 [Streptomyces humidus]|uniref:Uncharacterized protein n=1 Tax=Streptomyces humidus TaxID=52259 RepID=A0A918FUM3_9ACTN|nr:hypothetical protein [Streptomyces humidus]GGR84324.1 hypothetical protein GCM10010269_24370 [Streptomyces humidus]
MTATNDPTATTGSEETLDALLWRWAEHIGGKIVRPEWFACAGELTLEENVTWFGMTTIGGWYHCELPAGLRSAPVYAGCYWHREDDKPPVARVSMVVLPLADPATIAAAEWNDGYNGYEPAPVDGYAVLCSGPFDPASVAGRDAQADLREAERVIAAGDGEGRRDNWAEIVTVPDRGGNALFFPVEAEERDGYEALDPDDTIVCLAFAAYDFSDQAY